MTFGSYKSAAAVAVVETKIADAGVVVVVGAVWILDGYQVLLLVDISCDASCGEVHEFL